MIIINCHYLQIFQVPHFNRTFCTRRHSPDPLYRMQLVCLWKHRWRDKIEAVQTHHLGTSSWSSQVRLDSSSALPSSHEMSRGCPLTQVMRRRQSPGTGKRGKGRNLAETEWAGTLSGHLNPTMAGIRVTRRWDMLHTHSVLCSALPSCNRIFTDFSRRNNRYKI
jgi:hypothetical protein